MIVLFGEDPLLLRLRFWRAPPARIGPAGARFVVALTDEHGNRVEGDGFDVECWVSAPGSAREQLGCKRVDVSKWQASVDRTILQRVSGQATKYVELGARCRGRELDALGLRTGPITMVTTDDATPLLTQVRDFAFSNNIHASVVEEFGAACVCYP